FAALLMSSRDAETQWTFQVGDPPSTGTPDAVFTVPVPTVCSDGSGIVPAGGYVKVNTNLTLDTMVTNGGTCRNYLYGTYNSTSPHGVVKIFEYEYVPDYPYPLGPVTFWAVSLPPGVRQPDSPKRGNWITDRSNRRSIGLLSL